MGPCHTPGVWIDHNSDVQMVEVLHVLESWPVAKVQDPSREESERHTKRTDKQQRLSRLWCAPEVKPAAWQTPSQDCC